MNSLTVGRKGSRKAKELCNREERAKNRQAINQLSVDSFFAQCSSFLNGNLFCESAERVVPKEADAAMVMHRHFCNRNLSARDSI